MDNYQKLLNKSYRFLSIRPRSEKEVRTYLGKKISDIRYKISEENESDHSEYLMNKIIDKLKEYKFLDDEEFAKFWIEQRTKVKPRAWRIIKYELRQKGISDELINDKGLMINDNLDLKNALKLAEKRLPRYKNNEPQKKYEKMSRFLASKGFSYDVIKDVIDEIIKR